ncbi:helix-turn-helix domain-containing protein [Peribacillus butanolivorans]|uniref:helix-turn-helix domain-containing protein n=2 Tax=Peribacillus butanolivorans TaxID=421767 RepID=UPI0036D787CB
MDKLLKRTGKFIQTYNKDFLKRLKQYHWPGNIRELENVIEYSLNMERSMELTASSLPDFLCDLNANIQPIKREQAVLKESEKDVIMQKLAQYGYDYVGKMQSAKDLGLSVRTLYRKIEKLGIANPAK